MNEMRTIICKRTEKHTLFQWGSDLHSQDIKPCSPTASALDHSPTTDIGQGGIISIKRGGIVALFWLNLRTPERIRDMKRNAKLTMWNSINPRGKVL